MTDPIVALKAILQSGDPSSQVLLNDESLELISQEIFNLVDNRIYGGHLPDCEIENMPRNNVVLNESGGIETNKTNTLKSPRIDILVYGKTLYDASVLDGLVYDLLQPINRVIAGNALIHSISISEGAISVMDEKTGWHIKIRSITMLMDNRII